MMCPPLSPVPRGPGGKKRFSAPGASPAFTLVEVLVVIAIIVVLAALLLPALAAGREKAKVTKVHAELYGLGVALQMYAEDHEGPVPPVRVNCNSDLVLHWCPLPDELARDGYLPRGASGGRAANLEDPFNPGYTYKYAAPGPQFLNGEPNGNFKLWVPDRFPEVNGDAGQYYGDPKLSPVPWAVWSLGPRPASAQSLNSRAPLSEPTWYRRFGDGGVIARYADREGRQSKSP